MAVRIALQCTESDSSMILSEENSAGRLLSRPGEAIYNDANGLVEGNHFFQVVWLPESLREDYLRRIRDLAKSRGWPRSRSQIIFEGDAPALIARNALLQAKLAPHYWPPAQAPALAWLGDSIQIKNPTSASFHRQSGNNLLIVGQDTALAGGILASSLISLASHFAPEGPSSARFFILDGAPHDSAISGLFALLKKILPHSLRIGGRRAVSSFLAELVDEIDRRIDGESKGDVELFLFVHNLAWFREIRKDEAYEFTASKDTSIPSIAIAKILRDGPPVGIYVLAWSDNLNNLNRTFDRSTQREFGVRVAFQMSASDSSHYLDTPQASRLGKHMAYCLDEEQGTLEKFRPYGIPSEDCLTWVQEQFARRPKVAPEKDFA